jgi:hypothetical protein
MTLPYAAMRVATGVIAVICTLIIDAFAIACVVFIVRALE